MQFVQSGSACRHFPRHVPDKVPTQYWAISHRKQRTVVCRESWTVQ